MTEPALEILIDAAHRRREHYQTIELARLPSIAELDEPTILGTFSMIKQLSNQRLLRAPYCLPLDGCKETPSAIARDYLIWKYKKGPRVTHIQMQSIRGGLRPPPAFAKPANFSHGFYIDIRSTYWSVMERIGWKVDYWPGRWLGRQAEEPSDYPFPQEKIARNCLVSAGLAHAIRRYVPGVKEPKPIQPGNPLSNLSLFRLICDILNSIAWEAQSLGAVYINNDGYIMTNPKAARDLIQIIFDWSLEPRVKWEGPGYVTGIGTYKIGHRLPARQTQEGETPPLKKIPNSGWLQKHFTKYAQIALKHKEEDRCQNNPTQNRNSISPDPN